MLHRLSDFMFKAEGFRVQVLRSPVSCWCRRGQIHTASCVEGSRSKFEVLSGTLR